MKKYSKPKFETTEIFDIITTSSPTIDGGSTGFTPPNNDPTPKIDGGGSDYIW